VEAHRDDADAVVGAGGVGVKTVADHGLEVAGHQERLFETGLDVRIEPARFGVRARDSS
jgi:hypothetical protein